MQFGKLLTSQLGKTKESADVPSQAPRASVALLFTSDGKLCMIRRAKKAGDPWSGHMAFPGGREEQADGDLQRTAERETFEEVGIDLQECTLLGRLADQRHPKLEVAAFVYLTDTQLNTHAEPEEVEHVYWLKVSDLRDEQNQGEKKVDFAGRTFSVPVINVGEADIWGISLRFIQDVLERLETS